MGHEHCDACGFDGTRYGDASLLDSLRAQGVLWREMLATSGPHLRIRPEPEVWSAIEYAAHTRDVVALHVYGVEQALTHHEPVFPPIGDDLVDSAASAYGNADAQAVISELTTQAMLLADEAGQAGTDTWTRGLTIGESRSDVRSLLEHALHDSMHHLEDVERGLGRLRDLVTAGVTSGQIENLEAWLFDLDGVLTDTASVHDAAWKETFDELLARRAGAGMPFTAFDPVSDYEQFVDGQPRLDGVRSFLSSRDIHLPEGTADDAAGYETVNGVGRRKNELVLRMLDQGGVTAFPGSVALVRALRARGRRLAVVSASENCAAVLDAAGISDLFDLRVDGRVASEHGLAGKPAPDTYLYAARELGVEPGHAAVVEDAPAGVASGRAGQFGLVVGVSRGATPEELLRSGADVVVHDLAEVLDAVAP